VNYPTKLQTYFAAGDAPDLIMMAGDITFDFAASGQFEDLSKYVARDKIAGKLAQGALDVFTVDGKLISLPTAYMPPCLVYNKTLFKAAGIPFPKTGWTEADFLAAAKKLTDQSKGQWGVDFSWYPELLLRDLYGAPAYDFAKRKMTAEGNRAYVDGLQFLTDLFVKYKVAPRSAEGKLVGGGFETGKYGMAMANVWDVPSFQKVIGDRFEWDFVTTPVNAKYGAWRVPLWVKGHSIYSKSKNKDLAWDVAKFLSLNDNAMNETEMLGIPANLAYASTPGFLQKFPSGFKPYSKSTFVAQVANGVAFYSVAGVFGKIGDEHQNDFLSVVDGRMTVAQAVAQFQKKGDSYFRQAQ